MEAEVPIFKVVEFIRRRRRKKSGWRRHKYGLYNLDRAYYLFDGGNYDRKRHLKNFSVFSVFCGLIIDNLSESRELVRQGT